MVAGLCGYAIGKLSFKVRGAYFVIVTISFAEVTRLVALNWVELTQGPLALNNIPPFTLALPGLGEYTLWGKVPNYYVVLAVGAARLPRHPPPRALAHRPRDDRAAGERAARDLRRHRRHALSRARRRRLGGDRRRGRRLYAHFVRIIDPDIFLFIYTVTMVIMVITGGKGTLAGPLVGGLIFGMLPVVLRAYRRAARSGSSTACCMILIVFFLPRGIVPAVRDWWIAALAPAARTLALPRLPSEGQGE